MGVDASAPSDVGDGDRFRPGREVAKGGLREVGGEAAGSGIARGAEAVESAGGVMSVVWKILDALREILLSFAGGG